MDDKVIVTHRGALTGKYGSAGLAKIRQALTALVAADKKRGIKTVVVYLDDAAAMKKVKAKPVARYNDCRAVKDAIDAICKTLGPDYLMILGAIDVVPHQDLRNPAYDGDPDGDDDAQAWGDLPYACDTAYGRDPAQFVGPSRVVGRLPDLTGATEPSHLLALLKTATRWTSRTSGDYAKYFGLSAFEWKGSTSLSLDNIFGNNASLLLAPPKKPKDARLKLGASMHFINCHGGPAVPEFYGQKKKSFPVSLDTAATEGKIAEGTVAAVECCYGGQLYDSVTLELDLPICQSYLRQGTYGYLGSTTIAYGPADENGAADLLCQYFLLNVLGGASLGRAALMARQQFVQHAAQMDPVDLKTLAQFNLYGDPSIHPVAEPGGKAAPKGADVETAERFRRSERRAKLKLTGEFLKDTKPTASKKQKGVRTSPRVKTTLATLAAKSGLAPGRRFTAYKVTGVKRVLASEAKVAAAPSRYHLTIGRPKGRGSDYRVAVVAKELNGRIIDYCIYHER